MVQVVLCCIWLGLIIVCIYLIKRLRKIERDYRRLMGDLLGKERFQEMVRDEELKRM
jgi:hypothetical protein